MSTDQCEHCEFMRMDCNCEDERKIKDLEQKIAALEETIRIKNLGIIETHKKLSEALEVIRFYAGDDNGFQKRGEACARSFLKKHGLEKV